MKFNDYGGETVYHSDGKISFYNNRYNKHSPSEFINVLFKLIIIDYLVQDIFVEAGNMFGSVSYGDKLSKLHKDIYSARSCYERLVCRIFRTYGLNEYLVPMNCNRNLEKELYKKLCEIAVKETERVIGK